MEVFERYKVDPPKQYAKLGPAVDEKSIGVVIAESCLLNPRADYIDLETALEKLLDDISFEYYLMALRTGGSIPQVRVGCDTIVNEFVAQVQEYLIDNLHGAEWACRKVNENSGEVPWSEVEALCHLMKIDSVLASPGFQPWFSKLNRNRGVSIKDLLERWLAEENRTVSEEAETYRALLAKTRQIAGEKGTVTRSEAQSLTKEFDPHFAEPGRMMDLVEMIKKLFADWGDTAQENVPYLNLIIAWIGTRDFRRSTEPAKGKAAAAANVTGAR